MIRINKNLATLFSIAFLLGLLLISIYIKYIAFFIHHTVYYCQELFRSFSFEVPFHPVFAVLAILSYMGLVVITKLVFFLIRIYSTKSKLDKQKISYKSINHLLERLQIQDRTILIKNSTPFAYCFGVFNPKIYISTATVSMMSQNELKVILLHEKYHMEHKDTMVLFTATIIQLLFPFFPFISDFLYHYRVEREINADAASVQQCHGSKKAIISVLKKLLTTSRTNFSPFPAIAEHDTLESRICVLVNREVPRNKFTVKNSIMSICSIVVLLSVLGFPVHAIELHTNTADAVVFCINGNCSMTCKDTNPDKIFPTQQEVRTILPNPSTNYSSAY